MNFTWDSVTPLNGPSFQLHGGGGSPEYKHQHPVLNLQVSANSCSHAHHFIPCRARQVDSTGCNDPRNRSCPQWTIEVSSSVQRFSVVLVVTALSPSFQFNAHTYPSHYFTRAPALIMALVSFLRLSLISQFSIDVLV